MTGAAWGSWSGLRVRGLARILQRRPRDFSFDQLFFHAGKLPESVIELETGTFRPGFAGTLNVSFALVDDKLESKAALS